MIRARCKLLAARRRFGGLAACAWLAAAALAVASATAPAAAQSLADGTLLVATDSLKDPNFSKSVVLVLRHDEMGTIGVVINRVTTLVPSQIFPDLANDLGSYDGKLFRGGPVGASRLLFLVRGLAAATVQGPEVLDKVFLSGDPAGLGDIARLANGAADLRLYAGHAEWMAGQLEGEIKHGDWHIVPGNADLVFDEDVRMLWKKLSGRGNEVVADARSH